MHLLFRYVGDNEGWKTTTFEREMGVISSFHNLEEAKKKLINREILLCGVKLLRLFNGVK